jgi:uncharacterized protein with PIN domain
MVIDTSAIIAMLSDEPEAERCELVAVRVEQAEAARLAYCKYGKG